MQNSAFNCARSKSLPEGDTLLSLLGSQFKNPVISLAELTLGLRLAARLSPDVNLWEVQQSSLLNFQVGTYLHHFEYTIKSGKA